MKQKAVALFVLFGCIVLLLAVGLWRLGPPGIRQGDDLLLATLSDSDGARFYVIAHRTDHLIDAYEVTLYRVTLGKDAWSYYLAFEDGFWWGCTLGWSKGRKELEIRANGTIAARYIPEKDEIISHAYRVPIRARAVPYTELDNKLSVRRR